VTVAARDRTGRGPGNGRHAVVGTGDHRYWSNNTVIDKIIDRLAKTFPGGVGTATAALLSEIRLASKHRSGVRRARRYRNASGLKLHLGCGPRIKQGWVNVDLHKQADLALDLRKPLPFASGSCSIVYSEHFLEHLDYPEPVTSFVRELHRVLTPGGLVSLAVPDIELVLRSYLHGGTPEYYAAQKQWHPAWCTTQMDHLNYNFRQDGEHRFCYDIETITLLFRRGGFTDIRRRAFDPSLDSKDREVGSLYLECRKTAD
jgi:predicted SAM-dependent methyltransferase